MRDNLYLAVGRYKEKIGESQGQIGLKAGITESRLCWIIRGKVEPTKNERKALARVLGVDETVLFEECEVAAK